MAVRQAAQHEYIADMLFRRPTMADHSAGGAKPQFHLPESLWGQEWRHPSGDTYTPTRLVVHNTDHGVDPEPFAPQIPLPVLEAVFAALTGQVADVRTSSVGDGYSVEVFTHVEMRTRHAWAGRSKNVTNRMFLSQIHSGYHQSGYHNWGVRGYKIGKDPVEYLALIALCGALATPKRGAKVLSHYSDLLAAYVAEERPPIRDFIMPEANWIMVNKVVTELTLWMMFRDLSPIPSSSGDNTALGQHIFRQEEWQRTFPKYDNVHRSGHSHWDEGLFAEDRPSANLSVAFTDPEKLKEWRETGVLSLAPSADADASVVGTLDTPFVGPQSGQLMMAGLHGLHARAVGTHGTGKSVCVLNVMRMCREYIQVKEGRDIGAGITVEGHESMQPDDLLGGFTPTISEKDGTKGFEWADGPLTTAMRDGLMIFVDEANRMPSKTLNVLLGAISRGAIVLTQQGNVEVAAGAGFVVFMAMNVGQAYIGTNAVDPALLDRFPVTVPFEYLPRDEEVKLLTGRTDIDEQIAGWIVGVAVETRAQFANRSLPVPISPRGTIAWAQVVMYRRLLKGLVDGSPYGQAVESAAEMTWLPDVAGLDATGSVNADSANALRQLIRNHRPDGAR
jgi:MoxR-like ATPase